MMIVVIVMVLMMVMMMVIVVVMDCSGVGDGCSGGGESKCLFVHYLI